MNEEGFITSQLEEIWTVEKEVEDLIPFDMRVCFFETGNQEERTRGFSADAARASP